MKELIVTYAAQKFTVIGLTAPDENNTAEAIKAYVPANAIDYPTAMVDAETIERLGTQYYPHALLVNAAGRVVWVGFPGDMPDWIVRDAAGVK